MQLFLIKRKYGKNLDNQKAITVGFLAILSFGTEKAVKIVDYATVLVDYATIFIEDN